jgi:hypothetical protein
MPRTWTEEQRQAARERFQKLKPWELKKGARKPRTRNPFVIDAEQEAKFLTAYYAEDSETRGNRIQSAHVAGYAESTAETQAGRILSKYDKKKFQEALKAVGINNLLMAYRLRKMILDGADKDAINAIRLALAAKGESTDQQQGTTINATGQVMVIVGANASRINALRTAKALPTPEQLEADENARCQARLDELKARNRRVIEEKPLPSIDAEGTEASGEAEPQAG